MNPKKELPWGLWVCGSRDEEFRGYKSGRGYRYIGFANAGLCVQGLHLFSRPWLPEPLKSLAKGSRAWFRFYRAKGSPGC